MEKKLYLLFQADMKINIKFKAIKVTSRYLLKYREVTTYIYLLS
jgi:hypothetical protein